MRRPPPPSTLRVSAAHPKHSTHNKPHRFRVPGYRTRSNEWKTQIEASVAGSRLAEGWLDGYASRKGLAALTPGGAVPLRNGYLAPATERLQELLLQRGRPLAPS